MCPFHPAEPGRSWKTSAGSEASLMNNHWRITALARNPVPAVSGRRGHT